METEEKDAVVRLAAVGDLKVKRDEPETIFELCRDSLRDNDITFGQWELVISTRGVVSSATNSPGVKTKAHPRSVRGLTSAGFDIVSFASNHCLDWESEAMLDTIDHIRKQGIEVIGAGKDIVEARKPVILERKGIRIAFLAYNSILPFGFWAADGKPGCAPLRVRTLYEMAEPDQPGCPSRIFTYPYKEDLDAMLQDIRTVKAKADVLILSLHWGLHMVRAKLATYQQELGHAAIDAGADIIIGTHAHILKGVEVYKGKVIFYGLGNFAFDSSFRNWPNLSPRQKEAVELYNIVVEPEWAHSYPYPADARKTMVVLCEISKKGIDKVSFLPGMINIKAQPRILSHEDKEFGDVVKYMEAITAEAGLNGSFQVEGDNVVVLT